MTHLSYYHCRLKLCAVFEPQPNRDLAPFRPQSYWEPDPIALPEELLTLFRVDNHTLRNLRTPQEHDNLSELERQTLKELRQDTSIVIKPADKGGSVVIMDRQQYIQEALRQLTDTNYYVPLENPIYKETEILIEEVLDSKVQNHSITKKQRIPHEKDIFSSCQRSTSPQILGRSPSTCPQEGRSYQIVAARAIR